WKFESISLHRRVRWGPDWRWRDGGFRRTQRSAPTLAQRHGKCRRRQSGANGTANSPWRRSRPRHGNRRRDRLDRDDSPFRLGSAPLSLIGFLGQLDAYAVNHLRSEHSRCGKELNRITSVSSGLPFRRPIMFSRVNRLVSANRGTLAGDVLCLATIAFIFAI